MTLLSTLYLMRPSVLMFFKGFQRGRRIGLKKLRTALKLGLRDRSETKGRVFLPLDIHAFCIGGHIGLGRGLIVKILKLYN